MPSLASDRQPALSNDSLEFSEKSHVRAREQWYQYQTAVAANAELYYRKYIVEGILRQTPLKPSKDGRHIPLQVAHDGPLIDERRDNPYVSNSIRTSRYTIWDFVPKQLIFQFTRLANAYFLCVGIPQMIPGLSTTGSYTTIVPLLIFVTLTIIKEGYDDFKRHRLDKVENANPATVLRPKSSDTPPLATLPNRRWFWSKPELPRVTVESTGDEIDQDDPDDEVEWTRVQWRDIQVGDIVKLRRDEPVPADLVVLHATGENGLAYVETMDLDGETNLKSREPLSELKGCDSISGLRNCKAEFVLEDPNPDLYRFDGRVKLDGKTLPLTSNEVIYRGSTLRNTGCAIGLVINTGEESKMRVNANQHPRAKKPALERVANKIVILLVIYVIALTIGCSRGYIRWQHRTERISWYLNDAKVGLDQTVMGFIIMFNNNIPLSLYVTLEIIRIGQLLNVNGDIEMYHAETDTPARSNTNTILENLGQVTHIFSDKTGTLTENVMNFRKMSIAGTTWVHDRQDVPVEPSQTAKAAGEGGDGTRKSVDSEPDEFELLPLPSRGSAVPSQYGRRSASLLGREDDLGQPDVTTTDLLEFIRLRPAAPFSRRALDYILCLALCHTCLPEWKDGEVDFQAASPDELALVRAAKELGYLVMHRSTNSVTLKINGPSGGERTQVYQILDVIEFSSKRKRMSIVVKYPDGRIAIICKGADSAILPRLKLASMAIQKKSEVRESIDAERELIRRSEQLEVRNSFGGRPSLTLRRSIGSNRNSFVSNRPSFVSNRPPQPKERPTVARSKSVDLLRAQAAEERPSRPLLAVRTNTSFDVSRRRSPLPSPLPPDRSLQSKYGFLDDPSIMDESAVFTRCFRHLDEFSREGLRTLLVAKKFIHESEYAAWKKTYIEATTSLVDRQEKIEAAGETIEQSFELVGATAIEDKLQDGVPETIDRLRRANIKIWMLTGDKRETAINIAHSASLCRPTSDIFILDSTKGGLDQQIRDASQDISAGCLHSVVVIDGQTLAAVDQSPQLSALFYSLIPTIDAVICCRASPSQKSLIVKAIRKRVRGALTLAIGDGANDLAMIQASHVGVGISGKEGLQAARVADYSIAQFRFLQRLLLVHGRWNYVRTGKFILATFWKEIFFYLPTAMYQHWAGYTGTSLYESWSLTVLNVLFTSLCTIAPGVWEQDLSAETLLAVPELYVYGQRNSELSVTRFLLWMFAAASEGVLVFLAVYASYSVFGQPKDNGLFALGDLVFTVGVVWVNWKLFIIEMHNKTAIAMACFGVSFAGWWIWQCLLAGIYSPQPSPYAGRQSFFSTFGLDGVWWLTFIIVVSALVVVETTYKVLKNELVIRGYWGKWPPPLPPPWKKQKQTQTQTQVGGEQTAEQWSVPMWQEIERQEGELLKRMCRGEEDVGDYEEDDVELGGGDELSLERSRRS